MKLLTGTTFDSRNEMQGLANKYINWDMDSLVKSMNAFFVSVCEYIPKFQSSQPIFDADEPLLVELIISIIDTEVALKKAKVNKASGSDNIPPLSLIAHMGKEHYPSYGSQQLSFSCQRNIPQTQWKITLNSI